MKSEEFSAESPGVLAPIENGYAFVPNRLPPDFSISHSILTAASSAERALGELMGCANAIQADFLIQRPLMTREAVKSARIEGTYVIVAEMLKQAAAGPGSDTRVALDNLEVIRYIEALNLGLGWLGEGRPLNEYLIRALHSQLLEGTRGENRNPGSYRTRQVLIGSEGDDASAARFVPPPPLNVPTLMGNLVEFVTPPASYAPLVATAVAHYQFETIHPFEDGNGRMGRLLIPIWLIGFGVMGRPLLYLSDYFDAQREEYFDRLKGVSCRGEWQAWLEFFLEAVRSTAVDAVQRVQRITDMHGRFRGQVLASSRSQAPLAALDLVMERVFVTASEIEKYAHCSSPTAREALKTLTSLGIVKPMGGYPARWYSPELIAQAYEA